MVHRLWLDRPVAAGRPAFLGTADLDPLDNISVLERYERQATQWAGRHRGSVIELHAYAVSPQTVDDSQHAARLRDRMLARLNAIYPETASAARIVGEEILVRGTVRPSPQENLLVAQPSKLRTRV